MNGDRQALGTIGTPENNMASFALALLPTEIEQDRANV
jgi:hypothetical protein